MATTTTTTAQTTYTPLQSAKSLMMTFAKSLDERHQQVALMTLFCVAAAATVMLAQGLLAGPPQESKAANPYRHLFINPARFENLDPKGPMPGSTQWRNLLGSVVVPKPASTKASTKTVSAWSEGMQFFVSSLQCAALFMTASLIGLWACYPGQPAAAVVALTEEANGLTQRGSVVMFETATTDQKRRERSEHERRLVHASTTPRKGL